MEGKNYGSPSFINIAALLLFAIVIAVVSAVTTYFILNLRSNEQYSAVQPLQEQNNKEVGLTNQQIQNIPEQKPYFQNLPEKLQKKDETIKLLPINGFFITTSILSNKKDRIVYSEMSESIRNLEDDTNWEYSIFVKNLNTGKVVKIYSYPEKISLKEFFIKPANAGGCPLVYFPITWSKNDTKIIIDMS